MNYKYYPYAYYRSHYNINPYRHGRYHPTPYYSFYGNQIANVNQRLINYGSMNDVNQNSNVFQSRAEPTSADLEPTVETPQEPQIEENQQII